MVGVADRLLGLRGSAEGLRKLGLMTPPVVAAAAGGGVTWGTATVTAANEYPSEEAYHAFDNDLSTPATILSGTGVIVVHFTGSGDVKQVAITCRTNNTNGGPSSVTLEYSDNGTAWTSKGTATGPGYSSFSETQTFNFNTSVGNHSYWQLTGTTPFSNNFSVAEIELRASLGGPDVVVLGP